MTAKAALFNLYWIGTPWSLKLQARHLFADIADHFRRSIPQTKRLRQTTAMNPIIASETNRSSTDTQVQHGETDGPTN